MARISSRMVESLKKAKMGVCFRPLRASDAREYQRVRLKALHSGDGRFFAADVKAEDRRTLADWRAVCKETHDRVIMGVFDKNALVGTMSVCLWEQDRNLAYKHSAYVSPGYRSEDNGGDISKILDSNREAWARKHRCREIVLGIRADNTHWLETQKAKGATVTPRGDVLFANGEKSPGVWLRYSL